jgi:cell division inhibitor SepF
MGAWRKAGVWLGLVEDEDDGYDDEYADEDFAVPERSRPALRATDRGFAERERVDPPRAGRPTADRGRGDRTPPDRRRDVPHGFEDVPHGFEDVDEQQDFTSRVRDLRAGREQRSTRDRVGDPDERPERRLTEVRLPDPRTDEPTVERSTVRPSARTVGSTALSVPAPESLVNAPQVQLRERAALSDERLTRRYEITTVHPTSYSEARAIGEHFRDGHPVIMNLTDLAEADAKRLVDFAAGLAFGLRGGMERVTNRVFLLTPPNIRVSDEEKKRIAEPGFFNRS